MLYAGLAAGQPVSQAQGRVLDRHGDPIVGATVSWASRHFSNLTATTKEDGLFQLPYVPIPGGLELKVEAEGFVLQKVPFEIVDSTESSAVDGATEVTNPDLQIVLYRPSSVVGRVLDIRGHPVAGANVVLEAALETRVSETRKNRVSAITDSKGRFELGYTRSGAYQVTASSPELAPVMTPVMRFEGQGGSSDIGDLNLEPGVTLRGRITDSAGKNLVGVEVVGRPQISGLKQFYLLGLRYERKAETRADGSFSLRGLRSEDAITLRLSKPAWVTQTIEVRPLDNDLNLVMAPGLTLGGRVLSSERQPIADAFVKAIGHSLHSWSDDDGRFIIERLPAGLIELKVTARDHPDLELEPRELTRSERLEIIFPPKGKLKLPGVVIDSRGLPVAGARVYSSIGSNSHPVRTQADGSFTLDALPAGELRVTVRHPELGELAELVEVNARMHQVELQFSGGAVSGRVLDAETGKAVAGAILRLTPNEKTSELTQQTRSLVDGSFRFVNVKAGSYTTETLHSDFARHRSSIFDVESQELDSVDVRLELGASIMGRVMNAEVQDLASLILWATSQQESRMGLIEEGGTFRFDHLNPGEWTLLLGDGDNLLAQGTVFVRSLQDRVDLDLVMD